jgi:hypothetical protein
MNKTAALMVQDGEAEYDGDTVTRHVGGTGAGEKEAVEILKNVGGIGEADGKKGFDV